MRASDPYDPAWAAAFVRGRRRRPASRDLAWAAFVAAGFACLFAYALTLCGCAERGDKQSDGMRCLEANNGVCTVTHDDKRAVTCWYFYHACLPDSFLHDGGDE